MTWRRVGRAIITLAVAVLALAVPVPCVRVATAAVRVLALPVVGGTGRVAGVIVIAVRQGLGVGGSTGGAGGCGAVVPGIGVLGRRQAVVGLLDAQVVPVSIGFEV